MGPIWLILSRPLDRGVHAESLRMPTARKGNMIHKLKTIGLALAAVMAFAAISASAASAANEFHSAVAHTSLSGEQVGEDVFTTNAGTVKCKKASYTGTSSTATVSGQTVAPSYSECTAFGGFLNATVDPNGCTYTFTVSKFPAGDVDITCPAGKVIEVTTFACDVKVFPQKKSGITYTNVAGPPKHVTVDVALTGLHYQQTGTNFPFCNGGDGTFTNGTYTGKATIKGYDTAGAQVDIFVS
jgi:hypothetical protein